MQDAKTAQREYELRQAEIQAQIAQSQAQESQQTIQIQSQAPVNVQETEVTDSGTTESKIDVPETCSKKDVTPGNLCFV